MKRTLTPAAFVAVFLSAAVTGYAQSEEKANPCITDELRAEEEAADPDIARRRADLEAFTQRFVAEQEASGNKTASAVKYIPTVVHVIHDNGPENISKAQIEDAIRIVNEDFRLLNADKTNAPAPFQSLQTDPQIEFRLAQKDPNGNCTDGITRTYSELTNNARNNVKSLIQWTPSKYMNVWIVKSIENTSGSGGTIIGFATFPGGSSANDGVVVKHDYMGSIGTAVISGYKGRTFTHEIGHYMNLYHIWGSDGCSASDQVSDTPTQDVSNSGCPTFPHVSCSNGPNGDMYVNYMDYTTGSCENMFSAGQVSRMTAALNSGTSSRNNLWSSANRTATGTDGSPATLCTPRTEFYAKDVMLCAGDSTTFYDASWNGQPSAWSWSFPGGSPASSTDSSVTVTYNTPGSYNVTLTASNATGSDNEVKNTYILVSPNQAKYTAMPFSDSFENATQFSQDWIIENPDNGITWLRSSVAAVTGSYALRLRNYTNGAQRVDAAISPSYDIDSVLGPKMTYKVAYAQRASTDNDKLKIYVSVNCGKNWSVRMQKAGAQLATTTLKTSEFTPNASEWREETISLMPYLGATNVRFKFEFTSDGGNNIYMDDINISGTGYVGIADELAALLNVAIYPNPFEHTATVSFRLPVSHKVSVMVYDVLGKKVAEPEKGARLAAGEHRYLIGAEELNGKGVYLVRLVVDGAPHTGRLVLH